ncbi:hypothetical protein PLICRDRAFT_30508 [Plicaturopsis crispa FD-325 SS-3]|nr:hypothetical protein PLICRDRAFT_30508 [Plicaturopsis crispa FD-325 SS-3]
MAEQMASLHSDAVVQSVADAYENLTEFSHADTPTCGQNVETYRTPLSPSSVALSEADTAQSNPSSETFTMQLQGRPQSPESAPLFRSEDHINTLYLYGMPAKGVRPLPPSMPGAMDPHWPPSELSCLPPPAEIQVSPPPPIEAPGGYRYPLAPTYTRNIEFDARYTNGYFYSTAYNTCDRQAVKDDLTHIATPPFTNRHKLVDGNLVPQPPIPGMIAMQPSVPYAIYVDGDPDKLITVACMHTIESFCLRYPHRAPRFRTLCDELMVQAWGRPETETQPAVTPIFELDLIPNDRDPKSKGDLRDGSFNLAMTSSKGQGRGVAMPATQTRTPAAIAKLSAVNKIIHEIYNMVMPTCVSKAEWDAFVHMCNDNNVHSVGGLGPGVTGLQMNVSSAYSGGDLSKFIGKLQGFWHPDENDHPAFWTLLVVLLRLPPDADPGSFLLGRPALYVSIAPGVFMVIIMIKGNDMHSGVSPLADPEKLRAWLEMVQVVQGLFTQAGPQNRIAFVAYPGKNGLTREGSISLTQPLYFCNEGAPLPHKLKNSNFAEHGLPALGDEHTKFNRARLELAAYIQNFTQHNGLTRGRLAWLLGVAAQYHVRVTKEDFHKAQERLRMMGSDLKTIDNIPPLQPTVTFTDLITTINSSPPLSRSASPALTGQITSTGLSDTMPANTRTFGEQEPPVNRDDDELSDLTDLEEEVASPISSATCDLSPAAAQLPDESADVDGASQHAAPLMTPESSSSPASPSPGDAVVEDNDTNNAVDDEYEIEVILTSGFAQDGEEMFFVRWLNYDSSEDSWVAESELKNARALVEDFRDKMARRLARAKKSKNHDHEDGASDSDSESDSSVYEDDEEADDAQRKLPDTSSDSELEGASGSSKDASAGIVDLNRTKLDKLRELYDPALLQQEIDEVKAAGRLPKGRGANNLNQQFAGAILSHMKTNNELMLVTKWTHESANMALSHLLTSLDLISPMITHSQHLRVLLRAMDWQICRALLVVYQWYQVTGPKLEDTLFEMYADHGIDALSHHYPGFAQLIDTIVSYVRDVQRFHYPINAPSKARKRNDGARIPMGAAPVTPEIDPYINEKYLIPGDIYGLRTAPSLPNLSLPRLGSSPGARPEVSLMHARRIFREFMSQHIIVPHMLPVDKLLNGERRRPSAKDEWKHVQARIYTRGVVVRAIVNAVKDDGILASSAIRPILASPGLFFNIPKDLSLAAKISKHGDGSAAKLFVWLADMVGPDVVQVSKLSQQLGKAVWSAVTALNGNRDVPMLAALPSALSGIKPRHEKSNDDIFDSRLPLVSDKTGLSLSRIALILREALHYRRGSQGDTYLRHVLHRRDAMTHKTRNIDIDHYDPARTCNVYTTLLKHHLPAQRLTGRMGLSWLLTWMVTGQGNVTKPFLERFGLMFSSLDNAVGAFDSAEASGVQCDNPRIWGQYCIQLGLHPTSYKTGKKATIRDKLLPLYSSEIQTKWKNWLGPLWGEDPQAFHGKRHSHEETVHFAQELCISGLTSGLTPLQFANNMAILHICEPPTSRSLAHWIWKNKGKGAFRGLQALGFRLTAKSPQSYVQVAFNLVLEHLDRHLSAQDKATLGFTAAFAPMIVEHILCKVRRWDKVFLAKSKVSFAGLAQQAHDLFVKTQVAGIYPIPLAVPLERILQLESDKGKYQV